MFKKFFVLIFLSFFLSTNVSAGLISKGVKTVAVVKTIKKIKQIKDGSKPLLKNELKVGKYNKIQQFKEKDLEFHHIPSTKQIEKYGLKKKDGISIGVQKERHALTRTHGNGNKKILKNNETMRDALANDIKDLKNIYKKNGLYSKETRNALKEVIKQNKESFSDKYKKVP